MARILETEPRPTYELESPLSFDIGDASEYPTGRDERSDALDQDVRRLLAEQLAAYPILRKIGAARELMNRFSLTDERRYPGAGPKWGAFLQGFYQAFRPDANTGPGAFRSYWHGDRASLMAYERAAGAWLTWARTTAGAAAATARRRY